MREINNLLKWLERLLIPDRAFSWKTIIFLSLLSCLASAIALPPLMDILAFLGWIFLILGISWAITENPPIVAGINLNSWIIGALISIFIAGNIPQGMPRLGLIIWPLISAVIVCLPAFIDDGVKWKLPSLEARPRLITLILSHLVVSCWFNFYFSIQSFLGQYPTILVDNFKNSAFLFRREYPQSIVIRGTLILNSIAQEFQKELDNQPWGKVEKWLLEREEELPTVRNRAIARIKPIEEDFLWHPQQEIVAAGSGYKLTLTEVWHGPISKIGEHDIEMSCQISKVVRVNIDSKSGTTEQSARSPIPVGEVICETPVEKLFQPLRL